MFLCRAAGQTLLTYMSKRHSLTEDDVAHIIRQLCEILSYMHSNNVVHLDIRVRDIGFLVMKCIEFSILAVAEARDTALSFSREMQWFT